MLPPVPVVQGWPDTPQARVEALAVLQTLNAELLSHDSATLTLDRWCADHRLGEPAKVVAERVRGADLPPPAGVRAALRVDAAAPVAYRRVRLRCGAHVLSDADNWYVPARLTPEINRALDTSDIAFGRAAQALRFTRRTVSARLLWSPLPEGWETRPLPPAPAGGGRLALPDHLLEHRALLSLPDGAPISYVVERYTGAILDFAPPAR